MERNRPTAARELLDRGYGKPVQAIDMMTAGALLIYFQRASKIGVLSPDGFNCYHRRVALKWRPLVCLPGAEPPAFPSVGQKEMFRAKNLKRIMAARCILASR